MKCPFSSGQYGHMPDCSGDYCMLTDDAGECLIKQALSLYVSGERTRRAEEEERSHREMQQALAYWEAMKEKSVRKVEPIQEVQLRSPHIENHSMNI